VKLLPGTGLFGGFTGRETVREQRDGTAHPAIIDGQTQRRCVSANATSLVDGFVLQNGSAPSGGGMYSGTAINCTLTGNSATLGGGMYSGTAQKLHLQREYGSG